MQLRLKGTAHNLAIKGLFKYIDPNSAEAAALIAEGYEKVNWGVDLVKYKDHYTDTNLLPGVKLAMLLLDFIGLCHSKL